MYLFNVFLLVFGPITASSHCSLCSAFVYFGSCIVFGTVSSPSIFLSFKHLKLCSAVRWSMISLNLFYVCVQLVFDILFLRYSSADIGAAFTCLFLLVIAHLVLVTLNLLLLPCGLPLNAPLWCGPSSTHPTATFDPLGRKNIFVSIHIYAYLGLSI